MLALIGSALGFLSSMAPSLLGLWQDKIDKKHELDMQDKALESQKVIGAQKVQMVDLNADISETKELHKEHAKITLKASQWVINLSSSVRPVITYAFFLEFSGLSVALMAGWINESQYLLIWNSEVMAIWAAIISFWFGQRTFSKAKEWYQSRG